MIRLFTAPIVIAASALSALAAADWQPIRNTQYQIVGYTQEQPGGRTFVRDCRSRIIGYASAQGTFREDGRRVSTSAVPAALLNARPTPGCPVLD